VVDVRDETTMQVGVRVMCVLLPDADADEATRWVRSVWPLTLEVDCRLPCVSGWRGGIAATGPGSPLWQRSYEVRAAEPSHHQGAR
jgi:hypothetical protein